MEGESDFRFVKLTTTILLPLFPSFVTDFIGNLAMSPVKQSFTSYDGPLARKFRECVSVAVEVQASAVEVTMVLEQREGIAVSFGITVQEATKVVTVRRALENVFRDNGKVRIT
jgi:hypothetical protein